MTTSEMAAIVSPATGLLVYNTTSQAFYNYNGTAWVMLVAAAPSVLKDADGNTKVEVEKNPNEDIIRFSLGGIEKMTLKSNRLEFPNTSNLFIGLSAGLNNASGTSNTALGSFSMMSNVSGQGNTGLGYYTLLANSAGSNNVAIGNSALQSTTSSSNVGIGSNALCSNTTGFSNVAVGASALFKNTVGSNLVAVGDSALFNQVVDPIGWYQNTAVGSKALYSCTTGYFNTATGFHALKSLTSGNFNTANGYKVLTMNNGDHNTATGMSALEQNTIGYSNSAFGSHALYSNSEGIFNTAVGFNALSGNQTGSSNVALGYYASYYNNGYSNTCIGSNAGDYYNFSNSTFLGSDAYPFEDGYLNCMALGYNARVHASNKVVIGNTTVTTIGGYAGWTTYPSDRKFKKNVSENVPGLAFISQLRPVTYQMEIDKLSADLKEDQRRDADGKIIIGSPSSTDLSARNEKSQNVYTGFIAQEVEAAAKSIGYDFSGVDAPKNANDFYGLRYAEFVVPLVKGMQEQQEIIKNLNNKIASLENEMNEIKAALKINK
jgi:hypothetical protein